MGEQGEKIKPRFVIAGTASGVGKTTIAIGLMAALVEQGYTVQPFKVGPDYIDPGFHSLVTERKSRNLDSYFVNSAGIKEIFVNANRGAQISVIEGVMGLFDGKKGKSEDGSSAKIAKILEAPVILVLDAKKMAQSAAAMAYGYSQFDPQLNVAGVILNNIASKGHYEMIKDAINAKLELQVLGYLPKQKELELPERHLGLVPTSESKELSQFIKQLKQLMIEHIDLEAVIALAQDTPPLKLEQERIFNLKQKYQLKLGVAYDEAFNFYYRDNLDILESLGVELKYFSPIKDEKLPEVDGLYLGGGFPESFLAALAQNKTLKQEIYQQVRQGLPTYAECGGLIYLAKEISDFKGDSFSMVGLIPGRVVMEDSLQGMGYVKARAKKDNLLLKAGEEVKGHEFHYSTLTALKEAEYSYQLFGGKGKSGRDEGYSKANLLASYVHLHFATKPELAIRFLEKCQAYKSKKEAK